MLVDLSPKNQYTPVIIYIISNVIENVNYVGASGGALFELNAAIAEIKYDDANTSHHQDVFFVLKRYTIYHD